MNMASNNTIYPYGTNGELPSSIGLVNDLTTGGADKALTAEQGKVLGQYIYGGDLSWESVDLSNYAVKAHSLGANTDSNNKWTKNGKHQVIPVNPGQSVRIQILASTHPSQGAFYGFLTSSYVQPTSTSSDVPYATGSSRSWIQMSQGEIEIVAPSDAAYLCICPKDGSEYVSTWSVKLSTVNGSHIRFNTDEVLGDTKIINDTSTGGEHDLLAAEQGVVLKRLIDEAGLAEKSTLLYPCSGTLTNYINKTSNTWQSSDNTKSFFYPIQPGHIYGIVGGSANGRYAILRTNTNTVDTTPDYATGETAVRTVLAGVTDKFTAPNDAYYLSINRTLSGTDVTPERIIEYVDVEDANKDYVDKSISEISGTFNEIVVFSDLVVSSNNTSKITIEKDANNGILVNNINSTGGYYALIHLPNTLIAGEKYVISFLYQASFYKQNSWWLGFAGSDYQPTSGGVNLFVNYEPVRVVLNYTHNANNVYLRLASTSQNDGAVVYITEFSISDNYTSVSDLSDRVKTLEETSGDSQMSSLIRQARFVAESPTAQPLTLLHFSDIHGDSIAAGAIQKFFNSHSSEIDDMVQTGDTVYYYWNSSGQGYEWFQNIGLPQSLFVIGNHDGAANDNSYGWKEGSADWDFKGKEWDFDTYFAPYITSRGVTPPTGYDDSSSPYYKACYWHKDYADAKIRLIGIDCMHFNDGVRYTSNDQETWLAEKLQETLTSGNSAYGFSVVFLCHYPLDDYSGRNETWNDETHKFVYNQNETGGYVMQTSTSLPTAFHSGSSYSAEGRFSMRNRVGTVGSPSYTKGNDNPIADVIQVWMNQGGKFVVWLSGHTHTEYMYYPAKYPNMLCMGIPQAGNTRGNGNADRSDDSTEHTCANLIVIDTQNELLKVVRVGKTINKYFFDQTKLCYNYGSKLVNNK